MKNYEVERIITAEITFIGKLENEPSLSTDEDKIRLAGLIKDAIGAADHVVVTNVQDFIREIGTDSECKEDESNE